MTGNIGYCGTPLMKKLGIKPEMKVLVLHQPAYYFNWLGADYKRSICNSRPNTGLYNLFAESVAVFKEEIKLL